MDEEKFRQVVLIMAMCQNVIDTSDHPTVKNIIKRDTKRKLNLAINSLERDTRTYINKLYDTDDVLFQAIQEAAKANLESLLEQSIETTINESYR